MLTELGVMLTEPGYRLAERAGHTHSSTLGGGSGSPTSTTEANRARQFSNQEVAFGVGLRDPLRVSAGLRLFEIFRDLGEASTICVLGSRVQELARVAEGEMRQAGRGATINLRASAGFGRHKVQHMELPARIGEEPREVPHALEVPNSHRAPLEHNRPVIALAAKAVHVRLWVRSPSGFDPFENRPGRLVLQHGLVCPAAGAQSVGQTHRASAAS